MGENRRNSISTLLGRKNTPDPVILRDQQASTNLSKSIDLIAFATTPRHRHGPSFKKQALSGSRLFKLPEGNNLRAVETEIKAITRAKANESQKEIVDELIELGTPMKRNRSKSVL